MGDYELRISNLLKVAELLIARGNGEEGDKWVRTAIRAMEARTYEE